MRSISKIFQGEVIAIDGKTLRHSYDSSLDKGAIHMVSAWASANRLVLGQVKVNEKSNEITAMPKLLKVLSLNGCIVQQLTHKNRVNRQCQILPTSPVCLTHG